MGRIGERDAAVGFSLFVEEILQDGFGIDPDEFLPKDAIEDVDVARVDAVTVVHRTRAYPTLMFRAISSLSVST